MLSDIDLIREFIKLSIQKKEVLLANLTLQGETIYKSSRLTAKKEGVIATTQLGSALNPFLIKNNSTHWQLISKVLAEYHFILMGNVDERGFYQYEYCQIPQDYQMYCDKAAILWRSWWKYRQRIQGKIIQLELLIRIRNTWYPIRSLAISDGLIYLETLGNEIALNLEDVVIWLSKIKEDKKVKG
ncbi:MAG: hypothetical protein HC874_26865 [Richelia sp. SL_2_1]|nr:hypothetical protein [Richelia sp. SM2_1_7]NJM22544.1 hypothetical protein [Richelia sp. SM1_7_0]NJN11328.1 hypothetical protein [Richelia sp. RM1_1_1]NJO30767.1 hypothetical protein [Richelia sp. SL_2_1]